MISVLPLGGGDFSGVVLRILVGADWNGWSCDLAVATPPLPEEPPLLEPELDEPPELAELLLLFELPPQAANARASTTMATAANRARGPDRRPASVWWGDILLLSLW